MEIRVGLEPTTADLTGRASNPVDATESKTMFFADETGHDPVSRLRRPVILTLP